MKLVKGVKGLGRRLAPITIVAVFTPCTSLHAQSRVVERYSLGTVEGRLMGFYSAAVAFAPMGGPGGEAGPRLGVEVGLEASYVPRLGAAERSAGYDKPESSNLSPVVPRPRVVLRLPRGVAVEASWIPPVRVFDASAHLGAVAVTLPAVRAGAVRLAPRASLLAGVVRGAITCYDEMARHAQRDMRVYYATVCHGRPSDDRFVPRHAAVDVVAAPARGGGRVVPFAAVGAIAERTRFDIGVMRDDGTRDPDHPILELRALRPTALAGVSWRAHRAVGLSTEVYYAPRSLVTARAFASMRLR